SPEPAIDWLEREDDRARTIAVVSNMNLPDKGQADLLVAVAALGAKGLALRVLLVGDGPERRRLEARAESLGIKESVRFLGRRRWGGAAGRASSGASPSRARPARWARSTTSCAELEMVTRLPGRGLLLVGWLGPPTGGIAAHLSDLARTASAAGARVRFADAP